MSPEDIKKYNEALDEAFAAQVKSRIRTNPNASSYMEVYNEAIRKGLDPGWSALNVEKMEARENEVSLGTAVGEGFAPPQLAESAHRNLMAGLETLWELPGMVMGAFGEMASVIGADSINAAKARMGDMDFVETPNLLDSPIIANFFS